MKRKILIFICLIMLIVSVSCVSASEDLNQTNVEETNLDDTLSVSLDDNIVEAKDGGTFADLQTRIDEAVAGSTIKLENDYKYDDSFSVKGVVIDKSITIDGNGYTIDGMGKSHLLYVSASKVTLTNIKFLNGKAYDCDVYEDGYNYEMGAAIQWHGANGKLTNCYFENNTCTWDGGAIYWQGNNGAIDHCTFKKNVAEYGGAIKCEDGMNLVLTNSKFIENFAMSGGALSWYGNHTGLVKNCTFDLNHAYTGGAGSIYADNFTMLDCTFTNNYARYDETDKSSSSSKGDVLSSAAGSDVLGGGSTIGGALWWYGENGLLNNSIFINNYADEGGALYADVCLETPRKTKFTNCIFRENNASYRGGAVCVWGNVTVEDSNFIDNYAGEYGGGIFWISLNGTISGNTFTHNYAEYGGAIATCTDADGLIIDYCNFKKNNASYGGAIYVRGEEVVIDNCIFEDNTAENYGGAIEVSSYGDNLNITYCDFKKNVANFGGAVDCDGDDCMIAMSIFEANKAKTGGAIYCEGENFMIGYSIFENNKANSYGGAVFADDNVISVLYSNFTGNTADIGGALYLDESLMHSNAVVALVKQSVFKSNRATQEAGAIFSKRDLTVGCTEFDGNTADVGGAISTYDGTVYSVTITYYNPYSVRTVYYQPIFHLTITGDTIFKHNSAVYGGAINIGINSNAYDADMMGSLRVYEGAVFYNNTADVGGALHLLYVDSYIENAEFDDNSARVGGAIFAEDYSCTQIYGSQFSDNYADELGGTIWAQCLLAVEGSKLSTQYGQEVIYYDHLTDQGEMFIKNNKIQTSSPYAIDFNSNAKIVSPTKLIFADETVLRGDIINLVQLVDDKGNIIRVPSINVKITKDGRVKFYNEIYYDESTGGYSFTSDLEQGNYILTGYSSFVNDCTVVDGALTVKEIVLTAGDATAYYGSNDKFTANLTDTLGNVVPNEIVKITIDGVSQDVMTDSRGQASVVLNQLSVGSHDVVSVYETLKVSSKITILSTLTTNDVTGNYLSTVCSATLLDTSGKPLEGRDVTFNINGSLFTGKTDSNGIVNVNVNLDAGSYLVTVTNPLNNEVKQSKLTINKINSAMTLSVVQDDNDNHVLTAELVPSTATGTVSFSVAGNIYNQPIVNSKSTLVLSDLNKGNYVAGASYAGDNNLYSSNSNEVSFIVKNPVNIIAQDITKTYGDSKTLTVTLTNAKGNPIAGEAIIWTINSGTLTFYTNQNGQVDISIDLLPNDYIGVISYNGNQKYESATSDVKVTVNKIASELSAADISYVYGESGNIVISLKDENGNPISDVVNVVLANVPKTVNTDTSGQAVLPVSEIPGTYTAVLTYAGSMIYAGSSHSVNVNVKKASPKFTAKNKSFKLKTKTKKYAVTLKANSKAVSGVKLTLKVNGKKYKATTNSKGKATFKITKLTKNGTFKASIKSAANSYYNAAKKTVKITVKK